MGLKVSGASNVLHIRAAGRKGMADQEMAMAALGLLLDTRERDVVLGSCGLSAYEVD